MKKKLNSIMQGKKNLGIFNGVIFGLNVFGAAVGGAALGFGISKIVDESLGWGITLAVLGSILIFIALFGFMFNIFVLIMKSSVVATNGSVKQGNDGFGTVGVKKCKNCGTEYEDDQKSCKTCESELKN